ncbi:MAG: methyltransferase domain-containing protein [Ktedonobacterales bacterium]|nr:methyltransferase domain-containing protein [Ktedonobacterales bacterium]
MPWFFGRRKRVATTPAESAPATPGFVQAGGRSYMADSPYALPKDIGETNRLNFQHFLLRQLNQGNFRAPLRAPLDILDVGCGSGRWVLEMAAQFPESNVFGLDKVASDVGNLALGYGLNQRPANAIFVAGDILQGNNFPDASFDYVHMRLLYSAIPAVRWPFVINELVRMTRPGGWVELVEGGLPPAGGPAMNMLHNLTIEGGNKIGLDMTVGSRIGAYLQSAGLFNVQAEEMPVPLGAQGGRIGRMMALDLYEILKAGRGLSVARGTATAEDYDRALQNWPQEVDARQSTFSFYRAIGQKPS